MTTPTTGFFLLASPSEPREELGGAWIVTSLFPLELQMSGVADQAVVDLGRALQYAAASVATASPVPSANVRPPTTRPTEAPNCCGTDCQ